MGTHKGCGGIIEPTNELDPFCILCKKEVDPEDVDWSGMMSDRSE